MKDVFAFFKSNLLTSLEQIIFIGFTQNSGLLRVFGVNGSILLHELVFGLSMEKTFGPPTKSSWGGIAKPERGRKEERNKKIIILEMYEKLEGMEIVGHFK